MFQEYVFIDPEGSSEPQSDDKVQASYLTLCQYYTTDCLLFDQFHTHINTHKMPYLGCRSTLLKRADI